MRIADGMRHTVTCAVCGKTETILIDKDNHYPANWNYFCRITVNSDQTNKYYYTRDGKRIPNPGYTGASPKRLEYWECDVCFKK